MAARNTNTTTAPAADSKPAALDFGALEVSNVAEMPKRTGGEKVRKTPVFGWMQDSKTSGTAKRVVVPAANVKELENLIRQASNVLGCGARIVSEDAGNGQTAVTFTAKERRAYKPRAKK